MVIRMEDNRLLSRADPKERKANPRKIPRQGQHAGASRCEGDQLRAVYRANGGGYLNPKIRAHIWTVSVPVALAKNPNQSR